MDLKGIMQSGVSHAEKDKYHMILKQTNKQLRMISETTNDKKKTVEKPGIGVIRYRFKNNSIRYI